MLYEDSIPPAKEKLMCKLLFEDNWWTDVLPNLWWEDVKSKWYQMRRLICFNWIVTLGSFVPVHWLILLAWITTRGPGMGQRRDETRQDNMTIAWNKMSYHDTICLCSMHYYAQGRREKKKPTGVLGEGGSSFLVKTKGKKRIRLSFDPLHTTPFRCRWLPVTR